MGISPDQELSVHPFSVGYRAPSQELESIHHGWSSISLALGGILAVFYLWRRDLAANMIGHFRVDFVGNVLPKLSS
jgi:hypothetical protein